MASLRSESPKTVHLTKLAVGVPSVDAFLDRVAKRRDSGEGMQVWTRSFPRRAAEILAGGSLYWVVCGTLAVRQPILAIEPDTEDDGTRCTRIEVEPILIRVAPRPVRPFQGWRYLEPGKAPEDIAETTAFGLDRLPAPMLQSLRELCLV